MDFIFLNPLSLVDCVVRIFIACICGAIIGFERTRRQKEAGIRTHIIVALGAALMMIVSKYGFSDVVSQNGGSFTGDRIAANIITGVSFLGAGMIFMRGNAVRGLTTAAGIWSTAGVGMTVGAGFYILAGISTLLILIIQVIFHKWHIASETKIFGKIVALTENDENKISFMEDTLKNEDIELLSGKFEKKEDNKVKITYAVRSARELSAKDASRLTHIIPDIVSVEVHGDA